MRIKIFCIICCFIALTSAGAVDFTDIFEKNICNISTPISVKYTIEHVKDHPEYKSEEMNKQLPDADYEFTSNGADKQMLKIVSHAPIYDGKPYNARALTIGDSSVLYIENIKRCIVLEKDKNNQTPQTFWEYLTLLPNDSFLTKGEMITNLIEKFASKGELTAKTADGEEVFEYRMDSEKTKKSETSLVLTLKLKKFGEKLYPTLIKLQTLKFGQNSEREIFPPRMEIIYDNYIKLEHSNIYIPKFVEIKRANLYYPDNDLNAALKNDIRYWIRIKVNNVADSKEIIEEKLKFKIPDGTIIENKSDGKQFIIRGNIFGKFHAEN